MSVIDKLAISLGRRDEIPNKDLAAWIVKRNDKSAVKEVIENLGNKNKNIQSYCIKVIDEIGVLNPSLIEPYVPELIKLLDHKNNRLQWGAMAALDEIAGDYPQAIYQLLGKILNSANKGSVITKDRCFSILVKLSSNKVYRKKVMPLLLEQLLTSFPNQFPMYADNALPVIDKDSSKRFIEILTSRLDDMDKESRRLRVEKIIKKASKIS